VLRNGKKKTFQVVLGEREKGEALALGQAPPQEKQDKALGLTLSPLTPQKARKLRLDEDLKGLLVEQVDPSSATASVIQPGDIVLEVNRYRVVNMSDFRKALSQKGKNKNVLMRIQRGSAQLFLVIKL